jgi:hypothetical protein
VKPTIQLLPTLLTWLRFAGATIRCLTKGRDTLKFVYVCPLVLCLGECIQGEKKNCIKPFHSVDSVLNKKQVENFYTTLNVLKRLVFEINVTVKFGNNFSKLSHDATIQHVVVCTKDTQCAAGLNCDQTTLRHACNIRAVTTAEEYALP